MLRYLIDTADMKRILLSTLVIASSQCLTITAGSPSIRGSRTIDGVAASAAPLLQYVHGESGSNWSAEEVTPHRFEQVRRGMKGWNGYDTSMDENGAIVLENDQRVMTINLPTYTHHA